MKTAHKVLDVLEVFLNKKGEFSISEISQMIDLNMTTVHRICAALTERGYLHQYMNRGKYSLGIKLAEFNEAENIMLKVKETAAPFLKELADVLSETVVIASLNANADIESHFVYSNKKLQVLVKDEEKTPLHCTGVGKIFLTYIGDIKLEKIQKEIGFVRYTQNTITDLQELKKELGVIRREGIAFDEQEYEIGVRNVAAPVRDANNWVIAAIGVVGPSIRLSRQKMREFVPVIKDYADRISKALGYTGDGASSRLDD